MVEKMMNTQENNNDAYVIYRNFKHEAANVEFGLGIFHK